MSITLADTVEDVSHAPGVTFDVDEYQITPCACGRRFSAPSPSASRSAQRRHAETEAANRLPTTAVVSETATDDSPTAAPARVKICGCGCGELLARRAGGLFRSGHDARFKSVLARARMDGAAVRHPATGDLSDPLDVADWLDERRGMPGGSFWRDKVLAGVKVQPVREPRDDAPQPSARELGDEKARRLIEMMDNRHAVSGDTGTVVTRSGAGPYRARVVRRQGEDAVQVLVTGGPMNGQEVVIPDERFTKDRRTATEYKG